MNVNPHPSNILRYVATTCSRVTCDSQAFSLTISIACLLSLLWLAYNAARRHLCCGCDSMFGQSMNESAAGKAYVATTVLVVVIVVTVRVFTVLVGVGAVMVVVVFALPE